MTSRAAGDSDRPQVVLLIHGIRTQAEWQDMVASALRDAGVAAVHPIKYGYFDALRFWLPFARGGVLRRVHRELRSAIARHTDHDLSILAHSFGTYAVGMLLLEHPDIRVRRLALCGGILPRDFRWDRLASQVGQVINDCGWRDVWPQLADSASWGYGASGTLGFGSVHVRDRFHNLRHSDFFSKDFAREFWVPFFVRGETKDSGYGMQRSTTPCWRSLLEILPLKFLLPAIVVAGALTTPSILRSVRVDCQVLQGEILDASDGRGLSGVRVSLPEHGIEAFTDEQGRYRFELKMLPQTRIRMRATKAGYRSLNEDPLIGTGHTDVHRMQRQD